MPRERKEPLDVTSLYETRRRDDPRFLRSKEIQAPIVSELIGAGFQVDVVSDLYHRRLDYRSAIPILLRWLPRISDRGAKEGIVRALSVKWAKPMAAPALIEEFRRASLESEYGLKWAIGSALEVVADDSVFSELVILAGDKGHGRAREMVVAALGKMRDPRAVDVLIELLNDADVAGHALSALRKLAPQRARSYIERFVNHPRTWWRNEAKRALAKIDKAKERGKKSTEQI